MSTVTAWGSSITDGLVFQIYPMRIGPVRQVAGPENAAIQNLAALHRLLNQLLQGVLLRSDRDGEPNSSPGPDHLVHQCVVCFAQHRLREDG